MAVHRGWYKPISKKRPCDKGISASVQVSIFKKKCRAIQNKIAIEDCHKDVFKPAQHTRDCLEGLAILGQVPSIGAGFFATPSEQKAMANRIIALSRKITNKNIEAFLGNRSSLASTQLKYNGNCDWAYSIPIATDRDLSHREDPGAFVRQESKDTTFYKCPELKCARVMHSNHQAFDCNNIDLAIKCMHCKKNNMSLLWHCTCGKPWYNCREHARMPTKKHSFKAPSKGLKRKASSVVRNELTYEQLLVQDAKKDEKRNKRQRAASTNLVQPINDSNVVDRIKFGPKIALLLAKLRSKTEAGSETMAPSCGSASSC